MAVVGSAADGFLVGAECGEAEGGVEESFEIHAGLRGKTSFACSSCGIAVVKRTVYFVTMSSYSQTRRFQTVAAIVILLCVVVLVAAQLGSHGVFEACVLFFPVFMFGLLDLPWLLRASVYADAALLPVTPVPSKLFQRPPPRLG